jgi:hypothetical protein
MSKCPGYNVAVLPAVEIGLGLGDGATAAAAKDAAKKEAEGKALSKALAQFGNHMCSPPCISIPIPRLTASGADVIGEVSGASEFSAFGWAKAQLDVLCLPVDVPVNPPSATIPNAKTVPGDIAPVTGGTRR